MHQSAIDYNIAPAVLTAIASQVLGPDASDIPANQADMPMLLARRIASRVPEALASYLTATGIAAGLVAAWAVLSRI